MEAIAITTVELDALKYGVLGLSAIFATLTVTIIKTEQKRSGQPRKGIVRLSCAFLGFMVILACLCAWVQVTDMKLSGDALRTEIKDLNGRLAKSEGQINEISSTLETMRKAVHSLREEKAELQRKLRTAGR